MGGAERNARKKKQAQRAAASAVAASRKASDRNKVVAGVAIVVVLALVVIGGVMWQGASKSTENAQLVATGAKGTNAPVEREGGVVTVGKPDAKVTIDVYEDFLCPVCGVFKEKYADQIRTHVEAGELRVNYHLLPMLIRMSSPEGYSRDAANAALCVADEGKFSEYHDRLYAQQPEEGEAGWTKDQLKQLAVDLGVTSEDFKSCVDSGKHEADAKAELDKANATDFFKGTPTVTKDGQELDALGDSEWLSKLFA
ncbi:MULTISPECIES: thioredoxin domain-containing protein [Actinosynnema]|uniref:DsbA family protein n=1 Tax=Actinosynnema TaxID=40566 RepID=UPI0020A61D0B|nr:thioredoxin domain-containing protein [Actinosynnema pretiosum]MCP2092751.1 Protein-disulfide isomerase [Actinosynnema pretiosum]